MNSFEFELWIEQYKAIIKERGERPLFPDEIAKLDENIDYIPDDYKSAFISALGGDFSKFEKLPHLLRNYLGALELKKFREKFDGAPSLESESVRKYLENNAMNAALRAGISAEKNAEKTRDSALALDSYMNRILMKRTMQPTTPVGRERIVAALDSSERAEAVIEKNAAKQLVMAKMMLLAQIGKYEVIDKNGLSNELDVPVYETLVHGNRTNFVLPVGEDSSQVIDAFMGQNGGADAGIEKRIAATHSVKRRKLGKSGELRSESKEQRTYSPFKVFGNQYGMDIAAGGLGENGPGGEDDIILGDGMSGHMYMRAEAGDAKHCGSLLIGIEGSAPGKDSYLGNSHSIRGQSAKQSAFLADKHIVGKKVGGRQIDLSGISATDLSAFLNTFSEKYTALQNSANTPEGIEKLSGINDMLMGKRLDMKSLTEMMGELGMANAENLDIISQARCGYLNKTNASAITEEDFKQSVRAKFSQEQACNIAEARFKNAADNIELAVGAVKELMFTHETRSLGWKIRHPIKNYRENAKIADLTERLMSEKHLGKEQIASSMLRHNDTFSMNWGEGLSYDRDVIDFARQNAEIFKTSENKLLGVLEEAHGKFCEKTGVSRASVKEETVNKAPVNVDGRIKVMINEENIIGKETEKSPKIIQEQPTTHKSKNI